MIRDFKFVSSGTKNALKGALINTPIGEIIAVSDAQNLLLLKFTDNDKLAKNLTKLSDTTGLGIKMAMSEPLESITEELSCYFKGDLKSFKTPFKIFGSLFQQNVWQSLLEIPYAKTKSYQEQALGLGSINSFRAVATANATNLLSIIIPCHRVIRSNGEFGGYAGGPNRKQWLLNHELKSI